jgi:hypothetical protein
LIATFTAIFFYPFPIKWLKPKRKFSHARRSVNEEFRNEIAKTSPILALSEEFNKPLNARTCLLQTSFPANVSSMSAVELAVRKVKKLSAHQARELLGWLTARQPNGTSLKQPARTSRRKTTARRSMQKLKAWQESVRGTTDWQPPRMPDDLVKSVRL